MTETPHAHRWAMLPIVLLATFMASFDYMVVNVAVPSLGHDLHAGQAALELVIGGYAFTYAAAMVTGGRLGDLFGHRKIFALGMAGFAVASLLCGVAQSSGELIAGRLLQGLGAAAMAPQVLALITSLFPMDERARALSWFGVALGLGGIAGQVFGGLLLDADLFGLGWRNLFLVNVPVGAVAVPLALRLLPRVASARRPRLDLVGVVGVSVSLALILVPLVLGREEGWPLWTWLSLAAAVPLLVGTLLWEKSLLRRDGEPLLDLELFRNRSFSLGLGANVAFVATMASFMLVMTMVLQIGLGFTARAAGLSFVPMGLASMAASLKSRQLIARFGSRALIGGSLVSVAGMAVLVTEPMIFGSGMSGWWLMLPASLFGLGSGVTLPAVTGAVLSGIRPASAGAAAGVLTTSQQFAGAAGVAAVGAVFFAVLGDHPDRAAFVRASQVAGVIDLVLMAVCSVLIALLTRGAAGPVRRTADAEVPAGPATTARPARVGGKSVLDRRM